MIVIMDGKYQLRQASQLYERYRVRGSVDPWRRAVGRSDFGVRYQDGPYHQTTYCTNPRSRLVSFSLSVSGTVRIVALLTALSLLLILSHPVYAAPIWTTPQILAEDHPQAGRGLAIDSFGYLHLLRTRRPTTREVSPYSKEMELLYSYQDVKGWHHEVIPEVAYYSASLHPKHINLGVASNGEIHATYYDTKTHRLMYVHRSVLGKWTTLVLGYPGPVKDDATGSNQLVVDSKDRPHVVYADALNGTLKYKRREGASWIYEVVDSSPGSGSWCSLALDDNDQPHVSYLHLHEKANHLRYAYRGPNGWQVTTVDRGTGTYATVGSYTSIAVDAQGRPHISFQDASPRFIDGGRINCIPLVHAFRDGSGNWQRELADPGEDRRTHDGKPNGMAARSVINVGGDGVVRVVYIERALPLHLKYAQRTTAGQWIRTTLDTSMVNSWFSVAIDPADHLHIVFDRTLKDYNFDPWESSYMKQHTVNFTPTAPAGLSAQLDSASRVRLAWVDTSDNEHGFVVERGHAIGSGIVDWQEIVHLPANTTSYMDSGLNAGQYAYRVRAWRGTGHFKWFSDYSETASVTVPISLAPNPPTALTASVRADNSVQLTWTDNANNERGFKVQRKTGTDGTWSEIGTVGPDVTSFRDSAPGPGFHSYRVRAYGEIMGFTMHSTYSNEETVSIRLSLVPEPPSDLWVTVLSSDSIRLDWVDQSDIERGFSIERSTDLLKWVEIGTVDADGEFFVDSRLSSGTKYSYRVRAYSRILTTTFYSPYTDVVEVIPQSVLGPAAPSAVRAVTGEGKITISWSDNSSNEAGFKLERRRGRGDWEQIAQLGPNVTMFQDSGLTPLIFYSYRVRAYSSIRMVVVNSSFSNVATGFVPPNPSPAAPSSLSASALSPVEVRLRWRDNSDNADGFKLERRIGPGAWTEFARVGADTLTYHDVGLKPGTSYSYRIRTYVEVGGVEYDSAYTSEVAVTMPASPVPAVPVRVTASAQSPDRVQVTWQNTSDNVSGFLVQRRSGSGNFTVVAKLAAGVRSYTDQGLEPSSRYAYRVCAFAVTTETTVYSAYSSDATVTTQSPQSPSAPTALLAQALGAREVHLAWTRNSSDEVGFNIERQASSDEWLVVGTVGPGVTQHTDFTASDSTSYNYRVCALGPHSYSGYSNLVFVSTPEAPPEETQSAAGAEDAAEKSSAETTTPATEAQGESTGLEQTSELATDSDDGSSLAGDADQPESTAGGSVSPWLLVGGAVVVLSLAITVIMRGRKRWAGL